MAAPMASGRLLGRTEHRAHDHAGLVHELGQLVAVGGKVGDRHAGHPAVHGRARHGRRDLDDQARVERTRNQVVGPETELLVAVGRGHHVRLLFVRQLGNGVDAGRLHGFVDGGRAHIERATEDEWKAQYVVDLVRIIGAAGGNDGVRAYLARQFGADFGLRIGQRENQRVARHVADHLRLEHARRRQAKKDIGPFHDLHQVARLGRTGITRLVGIHVFLAAQVHHALAVADGDVFQAQTDGDEQVEARERGRASARADQLDLADILAHHLEAV